MISLNGEIWQIIYVSPSAPILANTLGVCDGPARRIYLANNLPIAKCYDVLLHELTHASLFAYGYDLDHWCHEELIASFVELHGGEIIDLARMIIRAEP